MGNRDRKYDLQCLCLTNDFLPLMLFFFNSVRQKDEKYRTTLKRCQ